MSWDAYFDETPPKEYRFLGFYKYRQEKDDFAFSFQKEANRLRKSLDLLVKNESKEVMDNATRLMQNFEASFISLSFLFLLIGSMKDSQ